jgi:hypothetical protein
MNSSATSGRMVVRTQDDKLADYEEAEAEVQATKASSTQEFANT